MSESNSEIMIKCQNCGKSFQTIYHLENHKTLCEKSKSDYRVQCTLCQGKYMELTHHLSKSHPEEYKCNKNVNNFLVYKLKCKFCDSMCCSAQSLRGHINNVHIKTTITCEICGAKMAKSNLYSHTYNFHRDASEYYKEEYTCSVCNINLKNEITYKKHINCDEHKKLVLLKAMIKAKDEIKSQNKSKDSVSNVSNSESVAKLTLTCNICVSDGKKVFYYKNEKSLSTHIKRHNVVKYKCNYVDNDGVQCNRSFTRNEHVKRHIKEFHEKKGIYKCTKCNMMLLERNKKRHDDEVCMKIGTLNSYPGVSKGERIVNKYLITHNIDYTREYTNHNLKSKSGCDLQYDFYIHHTNSIIEYHGLQHYNGMFFPKGSSTPIVKEYNDDIKERYAREHYNDYFVIDCRKYKTENDIFDLLDKYFGLVE